MIASSQYSDRYDTVVSADENGFIEYWQPFEPFELPKNVSGLWSYKSETDLYEFKKVSTRLCASKPLADYFLQGESNADMLNTLP